MITHHTLLCVKDVNGLEHGLHVRLRVLFLDTFLREWHFGRLSEARLVVLASDVLLDHLITNNGRIRCHSTVERINRRIGLLDLNICEVGLAHLNRLLRRLGTAAPVRISVVVKTASINLLPRQITISKKAQDAKANAKDDKSGCRGYEDDCPRRIGGGARGRCGVGEIRLIREEAAAR